MANGKTTIIQQLHEKYSWTVREHNLPKNMKVPSMEAQIFILGDLLDRDLTPEDNNITLFDRSFFECYAFSCAIAEHLPNSDYKYIPTLCLDVIHKNQNSFKNDLFIFIVDNDIDAVTKRATNRDHDRAANRSENNTAYVKILQKHINNLVGIMSSDGMNVICLPLIPKEQMLVVVENTINDHHSKVIKNAEKQNAKNAACEGND